MVNFNNLEVVAHYFTEQDKEVVYLSDFQERAYRIDVDEKEISEYDEYSFDVNVIIEEVAIYKEYWFSKPFFAMCNDGYIENVGKYLFFIMGEDPYDVMYLRNGLSLIPISSLIGTIKRRVTKELYYPIDCFLDDKPVYQEDIDLEDAIHCVIDFLDDARGLGEGAKLMCYEFYKNPRIMDICDEVYEWLKEGLPCKE